MRTPLFFATCLLLSCTSPTTERPRPTLPTPGLSPIHVADDTSTSGLYGHVTGPAGTAVAGATVSLLDDRSLVPTYWTLSESNGRYSLPAPAGTYTLSTSHVDYLAASQPVKISEGTNENSVDVVLTSGGMPFSGQLASESITSFTPVTFWTKEFGKASYSALPDRTGRVAVRLSESSYLLLAADPNTVSFGLFVQSQEDFALRIETRDYISQPPGPSALAELRSAAEPLNALGGMTSFAKNSAATARVWGLGEPVHGASESTAVRLALTLAIARTQDVTVALEANWSDVLSAESYIQGRPGRSEDIAGEMRFFMWRNREFAEALDVLRDHNRKNPGHRIHLAGIDIQSPTANLAALRKCNVFRTVNAALPWLQKDNSVPTQAQAALAMNQLSKMIAVSVARSGKGTRCSAEMIRSALSALLQSVEMTSAADWFSRQHVRDKAMADNAISLAHMTGGAVVIWAHNGHVARRGGDGMIPMGAVLAKTKGVEYRAVGVVANRGKFNARIPSMKNEIGVAEFPEPTAVHLGFHLASVSSAPFILDHSALPHDGDAIRWLSRPSLVYEAGGLFQGAKDSEEMRLPLGDFDLLAYLPTISPSHVLRE
jgi:erythromycin esterase